MRKERLDNRFRLIIRSVINRMKRIRKNGSGTSLNTGQVHDKTRVKADVKTNVDDDGITKGYNE